MDALVGRRPGPGRWPALPRRPGRTPGRGSGPWPRSPRSRSCGRCRGTSAFSGPWTVNGMAPAVDRLAERGARTGRRAGRRATRGQTVTSRAQLTRGGPRRRGRPTVGTNTSQRPADGPRQGGRGQRGVAARGDGQPAVAPATGATPSCSAASRCSRMPARCRALWLPATLPVSSFTQHAAVAREPEGVAQRGRSGRTASPRKPTPSTAATALVERSAPARPDRRRPCRGPRRRPPRRTALSKATSGFGSSPDRTGARRPRRGTGRGGGRLRWRSGTATATAWPPGPRTAADRAAEAGDHGSATDPCAR